MQLSSYKKLYRPGRSWPVCLLWYITNALIFRSALFPFSGPKRGILRLFGACIGKKVVIKPRVNIKYPWHLVVGNHCWIGEEVWIDNLGKVTLGDNCCLSQGALLLCGNHDYQKDSFDLLVREIQLEDGVWIGARAVVGPGVTCKRNAVLALASVATSDLEADTIYQGNPAIRKRIRSAAG